jgi:hypothetical protein
LALLPVVRGVRRREEKGKIMPYYLLTLYQKGGTDAWTEKKKKDELLEDTKEYKLVQQRVDAYCNDVSMVVVTMDSSSDYINSKNKKPYLQLLFFFFFFFFFSFCS